MKTPLFFIVIILFGLLGWAFAQGKEAESVPPAVEAPAFSPTETIRPDQGVAFPVDI